MHLGPCEVKFIISPMPHSSRRLSFPNRAAEGSICMGLATSTASKMPLRNVSLQLGESLRLHRDVLPLVGRRKLLAVDFVLDSSPAT